MRRQKFHIKNYGPIQNSDTFCERGIGQQVGKREIEENKDGLQYAEDIDHGRGIPQFAKEIFESIGNHTGDEEDELQPCVRLDRCGSEETTIYNVECIEDDEDDEDRVHYCVLVNLQEIAEINA
jgi:hypothetical protein